MSKFFPSRSGLPADLLDPWNVFLALYQKLLRGLQFDSLSEDAGAGLFFLWYSSLACWMSFSLLSQSRCI